MTVDGDMPVIPVLLLGHTTHGHRIIKDVQQGARIIIEHIRRMNKGKLLPIIRIVAVRHGKHKLRNRFQHIAGPIGSRADLELHAPHAVDETQYRDKLHLPQAHSLAVTLIPAASGAGTRAVSAFCTPSICTVFPLRGIKPTHNRIATTNFGLSVLPIGVLHIVNQRPRRSCGPGTVAFKTLRIIAEYEGERNHVLAHAIATAVSRA